MKEANTLQQLTKKTDVKILAVSARNIVRMGNRTKDTHITMGKKEITIPAGTTENFQLKDFLAITGMSKGSYDYRRKKEGFNWSEFSWGTDFLHMTPLEYVAMLHNQGLGWTAISTHLKGLYIDKTPQAVEMFYKRGVGIISNIAGDLKPGTHQCELAHPTYWKLGYNYAIPTGEFGIYLEVGAHRRLDAVARRRHRPNGLIYAIYGPSKYDKLAQGNASWIAENFRLRFGNKSNKAICAEMNLNIDCLKTFTPGPILN